MYRYKAMSKQLVSSNLKYLSALVVSIVIPFLIIINNHFPYLGIAISFIAISSVLYIFKNKKTGYHLALFILASLFSVFIFIRINSFLLFLDFVAILYAWAFMVTKKSSIKKLTFFQLVFLPLIIYFKLMAAPIDLKSSITGKVEKRHATQIHFLF